MLKNLGFAKLEKRRTTQSHASLYFLLSYGIYYEPFDVFYFTVKIWRKSYDLYLSTDHDSNNYFPFNLLFYIQGKCLVVSSRAHVKELIIEIHLSKVV